jgi:hypothetical protein
MVLARSRYIVKNKRRLMSLLNSSREFVRLENESKQSVRYDWVEKINKKDLIGTMSDSTGLGEHLSLNKYYGFRLLILKKIKIMVRITHQQ